MNAEPLDSAPPEPCRVLSLDGGGAKGFYSLGVLKEIEAMAGRPLYQCFDLIFGTSTGGIIAALLALGYQVDEIHKLYKEHVPYRDAPTQSRREIRGLGAPSKNDLREPDLRGRQDRRGDCRNAMGI